MERFYIISREEQTARFGPYTKLELLKQIKGCVSSIGHNFNEKVCQYYTWDDTLRIESKYNPIDCIVIDEHYRVVQTYFLKEWLEEYWLDYERLSSRPWCRGGSYLIPDNYLGFRNGPVPGKGRSSHYRYFRKSNNVSDRRAYQRDKEFIGANMRVPKMIDAWDDCGRSDIRNKRSWKKNKIKRQWMKHLGG